MIPGFYAAGAMGADAGTPVYRTRLQFGGADGSTAFTDDTGKTWTAGGNAQIDTSLGDQRGLFDGSGDYITTPDHADLVLSGDFKISFVMRFNSMAGYQTILSRGYSPQSAGSWLVQTGDSNGRLWFYDLPTSSGVTTVCGEGSGSFVTGQDYLIEIERIGTTITIKRDGATVATGSCSSTFSSNSALVIGGGSHTGINNYYFNGWIKDFWIT